jgi:hypothetical protein
LTPITKLIPALNTTGASSLPSNASEQFTLALICGKTRLGKLASVLIMEQDLLEQLTGEEEREWRELQLDVTEDFAFLLGDIILFAGYFIDGE